MDWMSLLERHDDTDDVECPPDFDWDKGRADFMAFAGELESRARRTFEQETGSGIQDASFHSQLTLPGGVLRFSNFGKMIAFTPDSEVPEFLRSVVEQLATERGYTLVPTVHLEKPYPRARFGIETWWVRYFDFL